MWLPFWRMYDIDLFCFCLFSCGRIKELNLSGSDAVLRPMITQVKQELTIGPLNLISIEQRYVQMLVFSQFEELLSYNSEVIAGECTAHRFELFFDKGDE